MPQFKFPYDRATFDKHMKALQKAFPMDVWYPHAPDEKFCYVEFDDLNDLKILLNEFSEMEPCKESEMPESIDDLNRVFKFTKATNRHLFS